MLISSYNVISLPASFENFRCAIETPGVVTLKIKITEGSDAKAQESKRKGIECNVWNGGIGASRGRASLGTTRKTVTK